MIPSRFKFFSLFLFFIPLFSLNATWLLTQCGLNESYRVLHLSAHLNRVFLSIMVKSKTFPTLIETQWPESYIPAMTPILYPHRDAHANGNHSDCSLIQQARWSQVDSLSRLWVMDMGWSLENSTDEKYKCNPKLLVFDLLRHGAEVLRIDCSKYIRTNLSQLLDIELGPRSSPCGIEKFIYFIVSGDPHILAYDILEQKWHYKKLLSKKYSTISDFLPIQPRDIAFGHHGEIFISDEDGNLYTSPNTFHNKTSLLTDDTIEMSLLGALLGPTRGVLIDPEGILFYVVSKFGAVVRCEFKPNMTAEDSEIVHMTSKNIQQIFFGSEGSVWILSDRWLNPHDQCISGF